MFFAILWRAQPQQALISSAAFNNFEMILFNYNKIFSREIIINIHTYIYYDTKFCDAFKQLGVIK